jgi:catechol 2,3-dioxygenase-like lactoylglutathione lyase family enzyme
MLQSSSLIAFAGATDLARARAFYEHTLGLRVVEQNDLACVFDANGTMLRITAVSEISIPGYTVLGWQVANMEEAVHALTLKGVEFTQYDGMDQDLTGIWTSPGGDRVAWFTDPDGNIVSLTEFAQG